jgi:hypothetical protein
VAVVPQAGNQSIFFARALKADHFRQSGLRIGPCHYPIGDHLVEKASQAVVIMGAHFVINQPVHHVPTFSPAFCHAHKIGTSCLNSDFLAHDPLLCVLSVHLVFSVCLILPIKSFAV